MDNSSDLLLRTQNLEEAILKGDKFYWDNNSIEKGISGGSICTKCKNWQTLPRIRKNPQPIWLMEFCAKCEVLNPKKVFKMNCFEDDVFNLIVSSRMTKIQCYEIFSKLCADIYISNNNTKENFMNDMSNSYELALKRK